MRVMFGIPAVLAAAMLVAAPAQAQFGGLLRKVTAPTPTPSPSEDNGGCPKGKKGDGTGRKILGGILSDTISSAAGRTGFGSYIPSAEVAGTLTDAIACRLDPGEQLQAAAATEEVTRGEEVGASASWTSATRENVSGTSTVVAVNQEGGGRKCMNVNDFIIVDGEETQVSKRMCKGPGDTRYVLAA